jgi:hypothetical protein
VNHALWLGTRGFAQVLPVNVSAYLVALIASLGPAAPLRLWLALFVSSWTISFIWWNNSSAAKTACWFDALYYATGAACGTIAGLSLTRWIFG